MKELVTTDSIINYLKESVENKSSLSPHIWIDAAQKLNVLLADEHNLLFDLENIVATLKLGFLSEDDKGNVSKANLKIEVMNEYVLMRKQKAKIGRIEEFIRIAKLQARLKDTEFKGY